jgi:hypothetical protein
MKPFVILWIVVLVILLSLTIMNKDETRSTRATILETDCLNIKNANPCVTKVKYFVNGLQYVEQMGVKPSDKTLVGKEIDIRYNPMLPNQIREYKTVVNVFAIPTVIWFLLGICVLYFMYNPIKTRSAS